MFLRQAVDVPCRAEGFLVDVIKHQTVRCQTGKYLFFGFNGLEFGYRVFGYRFIYLYCIGRKDRENRQEHGKKQEKRGQTGG